MAYELTLILRFEDNVPPPDKDDVENEYDCVVIAYETEDV